MCVAPYDREHMAKYFEKIKRAKVLADELVAGGLDRKNAELQAHYAVFEKPAEKDGADEH